jgi:hypothetical protein
VDVGGIPHQKVWFDSSTCRVLAQKTLGAEGSGAERPHTEAEVILAKLYLTTALTLLNLQ